MRDQAETKERIAQARVELNDEALSQVSGGGGGDEDSAYNEVEADAKKKQKPWKVYSVSPCLSCGTLVTPGQKCGKRGTWFPPFVI